MPSLNDPNDTPKPEKARVPDKFRLKPEDIAALTATFGRREELGPIKPPTTKTPSANLPSTQPIIDRPLVPIAQPELANVTMSPLLLGEVVPNKLRGVGIGRKNPR